MLLLLVSVLVSWLCGCVGNDVGDGDVGDEGVVVVGGGGDSGVVDSVGVGVEVGVVVVGGGDGGGDGSGGGGGKVD